MDEMAANPIFIVLLFLARCLLPLVILFGLSILFRKLGLISQSTPPPSNEKQADQNNSEGGLAHGNV